MKPTHLVLFDIDGTLLTAKQEVWKLAAHESVEQVWLGEVELMRQVIHDVTQIPVDPYRLKASGKTDAQVVFELFEGICMADEEIYDWMPKLREGYVSRLAKIIKGPESTELMPGVKSVLDAISGRQEALLSLLTGNFESAARVKLSTQKLEPYFNFEVGAFGDRAKQRGELPKDAVQKAKKHMGHHFTGKNVVIIGDTPSDVRCGKDLNVRTIAVATGSYSMDELKKENPDFLFPDLSDTAKVISAILKTP